MNPNFCYLLPVGLDYLGVTKIAGNAWDYLGQPQPTFQQIENFAGTGRTMLRWKWDGHTIPTTGGDHNIYLYFEVRVADDAPIWTSLKGELFGGWQQPNGIGASMVPDTLDYDGDGDTAEKVARTYSYFDIGFDEGSGIASIDSVLWVKGELDTDYTRFPDTANSVPGGQADYEMRITNTGGVSIKDLTIIDVLPSIGDTGVIDTSPRGSLWEPFLAGPVELPGNVTVYYSTAKNPCRPELGITVPGCEDPQWSSSVPADITTVHSLKFAFGGRWLTPGETMTLSWPMRVPVNAPTGGEVAWNSFGYIGTRADNSVPMLPSEPMKVGISANPSEGGSYGDFIFDDADRDGFFTAGELGINGVRIELYRDNGDGIQDPATDTLENFTVTFFNGQADGYYLFTNLDPGDYYGVVYMPDGMNASEPAEDLPPSAQPMAVNGDFEDVINGDEPTDWIALPGYTVHTHDDKAHSGARRLHVKQRSDYLQGFGQIVTDRVVNGVAYRVELFTYMGNDNADSVVVELRDGSTTIDSFTSQPLPHSAGEPWTKVAGTLDATWEPGPSPMLSLWIRTASTSDDFYVDSLSVVPFDGANDSDGERAVVNGQPVAMFPMTTLAEGESQLSWDQGVYLRAGLPSVWALAEQSDGRVILGGAFESSHGITRNNIVRVTENGGIDGSFDPGAGTNGNVRASATLPAGAVLIGGSFTDYDGASVSGLIRTNPSGAVGAPVPQPNSADIRSIVDDGTGRFLVTGGFSSFGGTGAMNIVRLASDLTIDSSFNADQGPDGPVNAALPTSAGKIIVVGDFSSCGGVARGGVARLHANGKLDMGFDPIGGANGPVRHIVQKTGGKIVLVGDFTEFGGFPCLGTVRLTPEGAVDVEHGNSTLEIESVRQGH